MVVLVADYPYSVCHQQAPQRNRRPWQIVFDLACTAIDLASPASEAVYLVEFDLLQVTEPLSHMASDAALMAWEEAHLLGSGLPRGIEPSNHMATVVLVRATGLERRKHRRVYSRLGRKW